jgi:probable phosphoglycerate mutase
METRLILIRHGHSWHKVRGVVGGPKGCTGLTDRGREQAARLRDRLARQGGLAGAALYSSTVPRAVETATIIAPALGATAPVQHPGLCSYLVSEAADGMPVDEYRRRFGLPGGGVYRPFEAGTEAWAQLLVRVGAALFEIAGANTGRTAVLVAHNETVQASLTAIGELPIRRHFEVAIADTAITEWTTADDPGGGGPPDWAFARWTLVRLNDAAHLEPATQDPPPLPAAPPA